MIGLGNLFIGIPNTVAYGINTAIGQEGNNYIPYIPSPDWSRGLITQEYGSGWSDSHAWSKGIGAFGVELLSGNVFSRAAYVDDVGRGIGLLDDVAKQADEIGKLADDAITWVKCFSRDTLVSTAEGPRPIGEIEAGEQVHSYNFEKGQWELNRVVERIDNHYEGPVVSITTAGDSTIETTVYHPFWVVAGRDLAERSIPRELPAGEDEGLSLEGRWVNSHELRVGDIVFNRAGQKEQITQISQRYEPKFEVSNLTIENNHNFAVGHAEILVHNTAICDTAIDFARKSGKTEDEIRAVFEKAGHSGDEIRDALAKVADPNWRGIADTLSDLKGVPWGRYCSDGCVEVAQKIQGAIDGSIHRIKPHSSLPGHPTLGGRGGLLTEWYFHEVVVKNGRVFDALTGPNGLPIDEFKKLWEYADVIDFGF